MSAASETARSPLTLSVAWPRPFGRDQARTAALRRSVKSSGSFGPERLPSKSATFPEPACAASSRVRPPPTHDLAAAFGLPTLSSRQFPCRFRERVWTTPLNRHASERLPVTPLVFRPQVWGWSAALRLLQSNPIREHDRSRSSEPRANERPKPSYRMMRAAVESPYAVAEASSYGRRRSPAAVVEIRGRLSFRACRQARH